MSIERMRVANSDWWPSRIVVSVSRTLLCAFIQSAKEAHEELAALLEEELSATAAQTEIAPPPPGPA